MLKYSYATQDEIPTELREHYAEQDGKFVAQIEGHRERLKKINDEAASYRHKANEAEREVARLKPIEANERRVIIESRLGFALMKARATSEGQSLLLEKLAQRVTLETDSTGKRDVVIEGAKDFTDLVAQAVRQWPGCLYGHGIGGGGSSSRQPQSAGNSNTRTMTRAEFTKLSPETQAARIKAGWALTDG